MTTIHTTSSIRFSTGAELYVRLEDFQAMSKQISREPQWTDAPDWAEFKAQDAQGNWFWYEKEPVVVGGGWYATGRQQMAMSHHGAWVGTKDARPNP